jgi:hypothetical protein
MRLARCFAQGFAKQLAHFGELIMFTLALILAYAVAIGCGLLAVRG